jgi:hypothetical protein
VVLVRAIELFLAVAKLVEDFREWKRERERAWEVERKRKRRRVKWKSHYF